jgi:negative regulator of replication initiation
MLPKKVEKVRLIAYVPKDLYESVCAEAETTGQSMSDIVRNALRHDSVRDEIRKIVREELGK